MLGDKGEFKGELSDTSGTDWDCTKGDDSRGDSRGDADEDDLKILGDSGEFESDSYTMDSIGSSGSNEGVGNEDCNGNGGGGEGGGGGDGGGGERDGDLLDADAIVNVRTLSS